MNYDQSILQIIESLKADKTIPAEYRNAVASSARRLQLEIRGAKTMTVARAPGGLVDMENGNDGPDMFQIARSNSLIGCICTPGMLPRKDCPVHKTT